jgi:hypothetical protein
MEWMFNEEINVIDHSSLYEECPFLSFLVRGHQDYQPRNPSSYDFSVDFDQIQNLLYATSEPPNSKLKKYNLVLNGK